MVKMRGTHRRKFNLLNSVMEILPHTDTHAPIHTQLTWSARFSKDM